MPCNVKFHKISLLSCPQTMQPFNRRPTLSVYERENWKGLTLSGYKFSENWIGLYKLKKN